MVTRGGSRAAATSKMKRFVIIVNGLQPLTIITKRSILDVPTALDPPLMTAVVKMWDMITFVEETQSNTADYDATLRLRLLKITFMLFSVNLDAYIY